MHGCRRSEGETLIWPPGTFGTSGRTRDDTGGTRLLPKNVDFDSGNTRLFHLELHVSQFTGYAVTLSSNANLYHV